MLKQLEGRHQAILRMLLQRPGISRVELSDLFQVNKMTSGRDIQLLMEMGLVRESGVRASGRGRPQLKLELDAESRTVLGVAILPDRLEGCRTTITGEAVSPKVVVKVRSSKEVPDGLIELVGGLLTENVLTIGLTALGFIDAKNHKILLNAAVPSHQPVELGKVFKRFCQVPVVVDNDMAGLAAKWVLQHRNIPMEDTLFVRLDAGRVGACLMVRGLPNEGCVIGANELGHICVSEDDIPCYCGQKGCIEQVFSTNYLARQGIKAEHLIDYLVQERQGVVAQHIVGVIAQALANSVNFTRAGRVVLATTETEYPEFFEWLISEMQNRTLQQLRERVQVERVPGFMLDQAAAAASMAALRLYLTKAE